MAEAWIASLLAFFAGVIVGIYLGKRRWDKNIQEEDCEEPTEQRRVTNRELAKWLAQGNGEWGISKFGVIEKAEIGWFYDTGYEEQTLQSELRVRKWDDTEWHDPTVDYMDMDPNHKTKE